MKLKLPFEVPANVTRVLSRYAVPLTVLAVVLLLGSAVAVAALFSPGGFPLTATTRLSQTDDLPETFTPGFLDELDTDLDGLGDAVENYVYGTNPSAWDSSGTGIPDGWLAAAGFDPLAPATRTARGALPSPDVLPPAYGGAWPAAFHLPLSAYYEVGKPADYRPGVDAPWWVGKPFADPSKPLSASGLPTAWLVRYGLDPNDPDIADRTAPGSASPLTVREAFQHNTNPLLEDSDGDGLVDVDEIRIHGTDPSRFSTSGSGIADGWAIHYGLDPTSAEVASEDPDQDGLTNLEEFVRSHSDFEDDVRAEGLQVLFSRGLDPLNWQTSGSGIPDGWYVTYGRSPYDPGVADEELARASAFGAVKWLADAPPGHEPIPDLVMTVRDAYAHGRPSSWREPVDGVWWGGTNPAETDSDGDGLPDAVEIRGWYVNVTYALGPQAESQWVLVYSSPTDPDSDADGLRDAEEYHGRAQCSEDRTDVRTFKATDPRAKDSAFSGLTDREKVCGVVRGAFTYDFGRDGATGLDPTRADSAGDYLRDGAKLDYWHERYVRYLSSTRYEFPNSTYNDLLDWTRKHDRLASMGEDEVIRQFRPDGDVDGDGLANVLDPDPSGGLVDPAAPRAVYLPQGLQIDPSLYRFSEYRSQFPRPTTDPANPDTDGDGLPDWWEVRFGVYAATVGGWNLDPSKAASLGDGVPDWKRNDDGDVIAWYGYRGAPGSPQRVRVANELETQPYDYNNLEEFRYGTNPNALSTAGDGIPDGWKVFWGILYPTLAERGGAGDLTDAELDQIRQGAGRISPLADLRGEGHPLARQGYARFVNLSSCDDLTLSALVDARVVFGEETLALESATGRVPCPVTRLVRNPSDPEDRATAPVARIAGAFTLTYRHEALYGTNPYLLDTDGDGVPDAYEVCYMYPPAGAGSGGDRADRGCAGQVLPVAGATFPNPTVPEVGVDRDADGADLAAECGFDVALAMCALSGDAAHPGGSNPNTFDTDLDGVEDGLEIQARLDPLNPGDVARFKSSSDTDRDGLLDYVELTGWFRDEKGLLLKTDPGNPDSDDRLCLDSPADAARMRGDGALDGEDVVLDPTTDAALVALWKSRGYAWVEEGGKVRFRGEVPFTNPRLSDTACDGTPDGWQVYYFQAKVAKTPPRTPSAEDHAAYKVGRPDWWRESLHGVWWWGAPPGGADDPDLDNDGLLDHRGEDPFPTTSANKYVDGAFVTHDPDAAAAHVRAAATPDDARRRAQAFGAMAGNPILARADAAASPVFPAATRLVDVNVTAGGTYHPGTGAFHVQKGVAFTVTGRLVVAEGGSPDSGRGVPNVTVLASALGLDPDAVMGVAFTDRDGRFNLSVNITTAHAVDARAGAVLFGKTGGRVEWTVDPRAIEVGSLTRGLPNGISVWTYRTPPVPAAGSPYESLAFRKASGATVRSVERAESPVIPLVVTSGTRTVFDVASALNGDVLRGELRLTDASGAPLPDRNVTLRWTGAGAELLVLGEGNVKVRTDADGVVNLTRLAIPVGTLEPGLFRLESTYHPSPTADPFLRPSVTVAEVAVLAPVELTVRASATGLAVGQQFVVDGTLRTLPYAVRGGGTVPGGPVAGETVRIEFGPLVGTARTDANGRYTLRLEVPGDASPGSNRVRAAFAGTARLAEATPADVLVTVKRTAEILDLRDLASPNGGVVTVSGKLVDNRGVGLPERTVTITLAGRNLAQAATGSGGGFTARVTVPQDLALGNAELAVRYAGDAEYAGAVNATRLKVFSPTVIRVDSVTKPVVRGEPLVLEGRLLDAAGRGVPSAAVDFYWRGAAATHGISGSDGRFRITFPVLATERLGPIELGLLYQPPTTSVYRPSTYGAEVRVLSGVTLELPEKDVRRGLTLLAGRLLDDRGNALPGQLVTLTWDGAAAGSVRTARNGSFQLPFEIPATQGAGIVPVTARYLPDPDSRFAPAQGAVEYVLRGTPRIALADAPAIVRGEPMTLKGTLLEDNGRPVAGKVLVELAGVRMGEAVVSNGRFELRADVPSELPRGPTTLVLSFEGARYLDPARLEIPVEIKIRPQVTVELPRLAIEGTAYSGEVTLKDDRGQPLRNQSFVYVVTGSPQPILATTDAEGRAVVAGVARERDSFVALAVKGGADVIPTDYRTNGVRVVGPTVSPGLGLLAIALVALVVAAAAALAYAYYRRRQLEEVRDIVDRTIRELLAGNEYIGTVFLAYKRLSAHLAAHGFIEKKEDTAREFATGVRKALPIPTESLRVLIRLFEEAKYSDHLVGEGHRDRAIESLTRVREDIDQLLGRPKPKPEPPQAVAA